MENVKVDKSNLHKPTECNVWIIIFLPIKLQKTCYCVKRFGILEVKLPLTILISYDHQ